MGKAAGTYYIEASVAIEQLLGRFSKHGIRLKLAPGGMITEQLQWAKTGQFSSGIAHPCHGYPDVVVSS